MPNKENFSFPECLHILYCFSLRLKQHDKSRRPKLLLENSLSKRGRVRKMGEGRGEAVPWEQQASPPPSTRLNTQHLFYLPGESAKKILSQLVGREHFIVLAQKPNISQEIFSLFLLCYENI